jgi:hypothetical protein
MLRVTLWEGILDQRAIDFGPVDSLTINDRHVFTVWHPPAVKMLLREYCGKRVRISIEIDDEPQQKEDSL